MKQPGIVSVIHHAAVAALGLVLAAPARAETVDRFVGKWGLAAYFKEADASRVRTAAAAACNAPYLITKGPAGGVLLHRPDETRPSEHVLKQGWGGKTYLGPAGAPDATKDREIISSDQNTFVLRWLDESVAGRYGTMVFVRCGAKC